jgi:hypothetical protein
MEGDIHKRVIAPTERLFVPHRKRLTCAYVINDEGARELRIDYGVKEITFDEARFFPFGERLAGEPCFTGEAAMAWGPGYAWDELEPLIEALLEEGILARGEVVVDARGGGLVASRLPPSVCPAPRTWTRDDCEALTQELGGRPIELGNLEAVIPAARIAHPALDTDARQVGEANVYPPRLRLDRETEWRVCQYAGSRYRDEAPMNVTALKAMIRHWKPMMVTFMAVRAEIQARLQLPAAPWAIGDLHILATSVLALPAFQLMAGGGSSPARPLHPVMSSLFRITDGIRMTTDTMQLSIEHNHHPEERITAAEVHVFAERRSLLVGTTGVCAGPKALIDEFLAAAVDGIRPDGIADGIAAAELPPDVRALVTELPVAVDYGLLGQQAWAVSHAVWLAMSRAYEALLAIVEPLELAGSPAQLRVRLRADWELLERQQLTQTFDREVHRRAYADSYERSWRAARAPVGHPTLAAQLAPRPPGASHTAAADRLRGALATRFGGDSGEASAAVAHITEALIEYVRHEQVVLASATAIQAAINAQLDRPRPTRALTARDLHSNYTIGVGPGVFPYLFDAIDDALGVWVECTERYIDVADREIDAASPTRYASDIAGRQ